MLRPRFAPDSIAAIAGKSAKLIKDFGMKAGPIEIGRLLQNRQRFCVPIYQRHYVWTRQKQWELFWNDVRTKAIECLSGRERRFSHFMGAAVLEARGGFSAGRPLPEAR